MTPTVLGSIVSLWRYPVKSMLGEELNATSCLTRSHNRCIYIYYEHASF
jgi:hypothetical protein